MLNLYKKEDLKGDVTSGMIVAALVIPQGIAYALMAGVPPVIGLYTASIPVFLYLLLGTSPHISIGPVAMISLLIYNAVSPYSEPGTFGFLTNVIILTFLTGIIQLFLALLRIGRLVSLVPHSVLSGFTSGCALIILINQVSSIFGLSLEKQRNMVISMWSIFKSMHLVHIPSILLGVIAVFLLLVLKKQFPSLPNPLLVLLAGTLAVDMFHLKNVGIQLIGEIPKGMPPLSFPKFTYEQIGHLLPNAFVIALIGFMETYAIGKVIAKKAGYTIRPNRELAALGLGNAVGSLFFSMPVAGGFSRSAVNYQSGAKSKLSSLISVTIVLVALAFFTGIFAQTPQVLLSVIILLAVIKLIDIKEAIELTRTSFSNGLLVLTTFFITITNGPNVGFLIGISLTLLLSIGKAQIIYSR